MSCLDGPDGIVNTVDADGFYHIWVAGGAYFVDEM